MRQEASDLASFELLRGVDGVRNNRTYVMTIQSTTCPY